MTSAERDARVTALTPLTHWAQARLDELVAVAYQRIVERIEPYRRAGIVPAQTLRRSVRANMQFMLDALTEPDSEVDTSAPTRTGRERAYQGMPLPEVLGSYRISFAVLWEALVSQAASRDSRGAGDGAGATGALLASVGRIWELTDRHAVALTEGYREATAEMLVTAQHRRSALVEAMLSGQPGPQAAPWEAARLLGFPPNARVVVVAAETRGLAEESLPGIEAALAAHGIVSGWRLTPARSSASSRSGTVATTPRVDPAGDRGCAGRGEPAVHRPGRHPARAASRADGLGGHPGRRQRRSLDVQREPAGRARRGQAGREPAAGP